MRALTPARPTASRAGAVTPITGRAATAPGLPYRHNLISTNGTDKSDRWVTSGSGALSAHPSPSARPTNVATASPPTLLVVRTMGSFPKPQSIHGELS